MLQPAVNLDAEMRAADVLRRLALNGFWLDARDGAARARIEEISGRLARPFDEVARALARDVGGHGAAIRRQWGTNVLWYARPLAEVLQRCAAADPAAPLLDVLDLHESDSGPPIERVDHAQVPLHDGVVMEQGEPVAVSLGLGPMRPGTVPSFAPADRTSRGRVPAEPRPAALPNAQPEGAPAAAGASAAPPQVWPRIDAPACQPAARVFDVVAGFGASPQAGVFGGPVALPFTSNEEVLQLTIELSAGQGVVALAGWSRSLPVTAANVTGAGVSFQLIGTEPTNSEGAWLTMLELRYVVGGTVCGTAARPLVILPAASAGQPQPQLRPFGVAWQAMPAAATPVTLVADSQAPDLTIEITKPDRNASSGHYMCQLLSPHAITTGRGPFEMDLGQDAKTFAKAMVEEVRQYSGNPLLEQALEGIGRLVAERLPPQVFEALAEVHGRVKPETPAVLIVSAEPYVPWELAWMDGPLDPARPGFLGAQAVVGRWLRDNGPVAAARAATPDTVPRPATHPLAAIDVHNMAVMAAWYKAEAGLRRLPKAEDEARVLAATYPSLPLLAKPAALRDMLNATLTRGFDPIQVQAVHFAGHGDFDPARPDAAAMFLEDGSALRSTLFRAARYGGARQPLLFLNACMLGIGGELLGDMAGFPGNSLRGGFGGVLGALWEVDDDIAHDIALEFWQRALPPPPARGEAVGAILRDLRARYVPGTQPAPAATYLAYVYYGHPRLTLQRPH